VETRPIKLSKKEGIILGKTKIKILVVAIVAILVTFINTSTLAFYQTIGTATNVVTSGNIRFFIRETTDQGTEFPREGVFIVPGDVVSKKVQIESDCDHPFYLRVKILYDVDSKVLPSEECFKLNINEKHWYYKDGWYYFDGIVDPYDTTPYVFSHVEIIGSKVDNNYLGKTLTLTVDAQAVQSQNNPLTDGKVHTANGWPKKK